MSTKPSIIVVPGSFSHAWFYDDFVSALQSHGYPAQVIDLRTTRDQTIPPANMFDDAAYIHAATEKLVNEGKEVVLLPHSYGGIPTTESAKGLLKSDREKQGKGGGIVRIVYMTALLPPVGGSAQTLLKDLPFDTIVMGENGYMSQDWDRLALFTFSDLPEEKAKEWAHKMPNHAAQSFADELTYPAYKDVDVSYIVCEKDKVLPPASQKEWIKRAEEERGKPIDVQVLNNDHCPMLSNLDGTVEAVRRALGQKI